ncbi:MAG TPA: S8 family peptidase [Solirubrobacteraceae bacterium]|nr:S8 family peptidase [Solirubrobacteraceae bacterium]
MSTALHRIAAAASVTLALAAAGAAPAAAAVDPMLADQWALSEPQAIGAQEAWTQSRGDGVVVAIIDSGVQLNHPDLDGNLWTNPGEVAGNGKDDDNNGFVDDVFGANMFSDDGNVDDDEGHGTHVAGIVAARAGNGTGGSGLAPNARIMAVKVLDSSRSGNSTLLARGIKYAIDEGAQILNVSINGDGTSSDLTTVLKYASDRGVTVVSSAGNNSRDLDLTPSYPASSTEPSVLSVTATGITGSLLDFANRGLRSVDLAAPGESILSTARGSGYENRSGTSMSAPYVSGALALLAAARPDLSQAALRNALMSTAPERGLLASVLGGGALDVGAAMHAILPGGMWKASASASARAATASASLSLRSGKQIRAGRRASLRWTATGADSVASWQILLDGRKVATRGGGATGSLRKKIAKAGTHRWKVVGYDAEGERVVAKSRGFRVLRAR